MKKDFSKFVVFDTEKFNEDAKKVQKARNHITGKDDKVTRVIEESGLYATIVPNSFRQFNTYKGEIIGLDRMVLPDRPGMITFPKLRLLCSIFDLEPEKYLIKPEEVNDPVEEANVNTDKIDILIDAVEYNSKLLQRLIDLWEK